MLRVGIWVESLKCTGILFSQWHGENFAHRQHLKFCHYQPVHCASKILYLPTYSTDFRNLCLRSNMLRLGTWAESFWCAGILLLQCQGENIAHGQHLKFGHFQRVPCASKNPISPKVFNRFSKPWPQHEHVEGGHLGRKFHVHRYLSFAMSRWKLCAWTTFDIFHFQPVHCAGKNPISPKVLNRLSKFWPQVEDVEGGHLGGKFQVHRYFIFTMARWKLCASTTFEILPLSTCSLCQQNPISPNVFNRFSKSLPQLEDIEGGHLGGKFQVHRYLTFAMARWKLCAWTTFEIWPLSTCTLCQQKSHISKGIQPIFEILASARTCWAWAFGKKVSRAQVFIFCNVKVKTLRIDNIWHFPLSTCTLCQQKSYISKGIQPIFEIFRKSVEYVWRYRNLLAPWTGW